MKGLIFVAATLLLIIIQYGCIGIKPTGSQGINKYYETFYTGQNQIQYFIKPLKYCSENKMQLLLDYSFRNTHNSSDSVAVRFSIKSKIIIKKIDSVLLFDGIKIIRVQNMFVESKKKSIESRFTLDVPLSSLKNALGKKDEKISIYFQGQYCTFKVQHKSLKKIEYLEQHLIPVL